MAMQAADVAALEKEKVKGAPDSGASKLASAFRKKKKAPAKQAPPPPGAMPGGAY